MSEKRFEFNEKERADLCIIMNSQVLDNGDTIDRIEHIINEREEWVRVEDGLPEIADNLVIGLFENGSIETIHIHEWFTYLTSGTDTNGNLTYKRWFEVAKPTITHWQPLPSFPKHNQQ